MKDGGPAFPRTGFYHDNGDLSYDTEPSSGMSLRDWFAGQVLCGMNASPKLMRYLTTETPIEDCAKELALAAYQQADAMLTEREKGE